MSQNSQIEKEIKERIIGIPVKINLDVNIDGTSTKIPLTSSLLYYPVFEEEKDEKKDNEKDKEKNEKETIQKGGETQYPLLPPIGMDYPVEKLRQLTFKDLIDTLFNPVTFSKKMSEWKSNIEENQDQEPEPEKPDPEKPDKKQKQQSVLVSEESKQTIIWEKKNMQILLHLLFPTDAFNSKEYKTSMHYWNSSETSYSLPKERSFSYLKYQGKIYTITNAVWLNDILNISSYQHYTEPFENYYEWTISIQKIIKKKIGRIQDILKNANTSSEVSHSQKITKQNLEKLLKLLNENKEFGMPALRPIFRLDGLKQMTFHAIEYLDSFTKMNFMSHANETLNDLFDVKNVYLYQDSEKNNHELLYQLLKNIYEFKKYKLHSLSNYLPSPNQNQDALTTFYYAGLITKESEKAYTRHFSAKVIVDVIGGLVNKNNRSVIDCRYNDLWIAKMMKFFSTTYWNVREDRIYLDLSDLDAKQKTMKETNDDYKKKSRNSFRDEDDNNRSYKRNTGNQQNFGNFNQNVLGNTSERMVSVSVLSDFFNGKILNLGKESKKKEMEEMLKYFQENMDKLDDFSFYPIEINKLFEKIVYHKLSKPLLEYAKKKNKSVVSILESEDFIMKSINFLYLLKNKTNEFSKSKSIKEWENQKTNVEKYLALLNIDIQTKFSDFNNSDANLSQIKSHQREYYNYLLLILYRNLLENIGAFMDEKLDSLDKNEKNQAGTRKIREMQNKTKKMFRF